MFLEVNSDFGVKLYKQENPHSGPLLMNCGRCVSLPPSRPASMYLQLLTILPIISECKQLYCHFRQKSICICICCHNSAVHHKSDLGLHFNFIIRESVPLYVIASHHKKCVCAMNSLSFAASPSVCAHRED